MRGFGFNSVSFMLKKVGSGMHMSNSSSEKKYIEYFVLQGYLNTASKKS